MIKKATLYKQIESLPDTLEIEDLIEKLLLIAKIDERILESEGGETISELELDQQIEKWAN